MFLRWWNWYYVQFKVIYCDMTVSIFQHAILKYVKKLKYERIAYNDL